MGGIIAGSEAREGDDDVIIGVFGTGFAKTEISYLGIWDYKTGVGSESGVIISYLAASWGRSIAGAGLYGLMIDLTKIFCIPNVILSVLLN